LNTISAVEHISSRSC